MVKLEEGSPEFGVRRPAFEANPGLRTPNPGLRTPNPGLRTPNPGLYIHIPFCQAICSYCNFNRGLLDVDLKRAYVAALQREIAEAGGAFAGRAFDTIFFGGGTPSLLDPDEIASVLAAAHRALVVAPGAEITLETNPETATLDRLSRFRDAGINRISFGVQSFNDEELKRLGRIHSSARAEEAIRDARRAGFDNLSFDLMLWLPEQTPASWARTVARAIALEPDHLSLYLLELYPNAPLKEEMARGQWTQTTDDDAADMYLDGLQRLDEAGYAQYEISNVARVGRASHHNLKYWMSGDWLGVGCGAHSTVDGVRWKNMASTEGYVDCVTAGRSPAIEPASLTREARIQEALFTGLRLSAGIDESAFAARWGVDPWGRHADSFEDRVLAGHIWRSGGRFGLTRSGMLVANDILSAVV